MVPDCHRRVDAHGLCATHLARVQAGKPLVASWEQDPAVGVLPRGADWVLCLECGRTFKALSSHLRGAHGLTGPEFKRRHGLPASTPLMCEDLANKIGAQSQKRVGSPAWRRFEERRDATSMDTIREAGKARRTVGSRRLLSEKATGRPRTRTCPMCGRLLERGQKFCSRSCAEAHRLQMTHERDARLAGEPLNFTRHTGTGGKVTQEGFPMFGITWGAWRQRVHVGTAPEHDGRVDGQRFWWESTVRRVL